MLEPAYCHTVLKWHIKDINPHDAIGLYCHGRPETQDKAPP